MLSSSSFSKGPRNVNYKLNNHPQSYEKHELYKTHDASIRNNSQESLESKTIYIRVRRVYLKYTFKNALNFYKFLDNNKIFGLVEQMPENSVKNAAFIEEFKENDPNWKDKLLPTQNGLIITYYNDLIANKKYRTVSQSSFNVWVPNEQDAEPQFIDDRYSIEKNGSLIGKNNEDSINNGKIVGLRVENQQLQVIFRYEWEFEQFMTDTKAMGLVAGGAWIEQPETEESEVVASGQNDTVHTTTSSSTANNKVESTETDTAAKSNDETGDTAKDTQESKDNSNERKEEEGFLDIVTEFEGLEMKDYRIVVNGSCDDFAMMDPKPKRKAMKKSSKSKTSKKTSFFGFGS